MGFSLVLPWLVVCGESRSHRHRASRLALLLVVALLLGLVVRGAVGRRH
ncbi:MAG: hypothetical protein LKM39_08370 [Chiayiivirga sp.]|jgi:hypothetical protein|nr:hypothetical protein [Chiayiivirga sp.]